MRLAQSLLFGNLAAFFLPTLALAQSAPISATEMNAAFGVPLWADDQLWDDADSEVGKRLGWRPESRTTDSASFRLYAPPEMRVLGARPFSLAMQGTDGQVAQISMVFANKGDVEQLVELPPGLTKIQADRERTRQIREYAKFIQADSAAISARLTELLGPPTAATFGDNRAAAEKVSRWDWQGHAILLAAPRGEYVAVRVVPTTVADGGTADRIGDAELMARLAERVEKRANGDVIIRDIPMVDQGPKGYCVPATWERTLRYLGIPADMYMLAIAGSTEVGGGTSSQAMMAGVAEIVRAAGRRLETSGGRITTRSVARTIDRGLPLMWTMFVVPELNRAVSDRSRQRETVNDWDAYGKLLEPWRKEARSIRTDRDNGHMCMIIGYNHETKEIAISDSWGPEFAERWITEEEANAISQGNFYLVNR